ncbi:MAG: hypothetical protein R3324_09470, partial [Halobacteriales archaeon]|nr:hypothetical protein [Halobacteriales archaeon]
TMIYVTHDQEEAFFLSDEIVIMRQGKLVEKGPPEDLYVSPREAFTRGFVGRWNEFSGTVRNSTIETDVFDLDAPDELSHQGQVRCYIRPTDVTIDHDGRAADVPDTHTRIDGTVVSEGLLGELYELTIDISGAVGDDIEIDREKELTVHTLEHLRYQRGAEISVFIDPETVQVYAEGEGG